MPNRSVTTALIASLALLPACEDMTPQERTVAGVIVGGAAGFITAEALHANKNWTLVAVLAGAVAGTLVARNYETQQCAYSNGDGTYYVASCP